ncbi:Very-short-patch-repair endonuclease [Fodinibius salinus]|uniref:Very-short-patch-repair endonuclease n=1 Tax=Fodinibius salinus TaxID=860790 RepID=A0A5D3YIF7_9BACT|nr:DUF559 domain-containing protein [Fodinibius salinus]TYP93345.1 Very-short-patch-repair endonuclease [Fodinibius salinus]
MAISFIPYNQKLVPLAVKLRNNSTVCNKLLWEELRERKLLGYKFDRHKPLGEYIVDFYSPELMLAIEIKDSKADYKSGYDKRRRKEIERFGVKVVTITDLQIKNNIKRVVERLKQQIKQIKESPNIA